MIRRTFAGLALAVAMVLLPTGCAYRLGNIGGKEIQGVHSVYVPMAVNKSLTPQISAQVTNAIIRRFDNDGALETVSDSKADSELQVTITDVRRYPLRGTKTDVLVTAEYEVAIECEVNFYNRRIGTKPLTNRRVTGTTDFFVQNDQQEGERQALPLAAEALAQNIVSLITEGW